MAPLQTTRLLLIRHGESEANANKIMQGWSDSPLSQRGYEQARQLAEWLRITYPDADALFASPLQRAYQTAAAVGEALGLDVQVRPELRELGLGKLEDVDELTMITALKDPHFERTYEVETLPVFGERVLGALSGLLAIHEGKTIIVVVHGGVIGMACSYWLDHDISRTWSDYYTENASINELVFGVTPVELVRHNETDHLSSLSDG